MLDTRFQLLNFNLLRLHCFNQQGCHACVVDALNFVRPGITRRYFRNDLIDILGKGRPRLAPLHLAFLRDT